jgi:hypothetical protein
MRPYSRDTRAVQREQFYLEADDDTVEREKSGRRYRVHQRQCSPSAAFIALSSARNRARPPPRNAFCELRRFLQRSSARLTAVSGTPPFFENRNRSAGRPRCKAFIPKNGRKPAP